MLEQQTDDQEAATSVLMCADALTYCLPYLANAQRAYVEAAMEVAATRQSERVVKLVDTAGMELSGVYELIKVLAERMTISASAYAASAEIKARDEKGATQH